MSKAFTSESDDNDDEPFLQPPALPPGVPNYITPQGAKKLQDVVTQLLAQRAELSGNDLDQERRRRIIDRRLQVLAAQQDSAQVIDPAQQPTDQVRFGAAVTVTPQEGASETWKIVGVDEVDLDRNRISWRSPLAGAFLEKKVGDRVTFGPQRFIIEKIDYTEERPDA